MSELVSIVVPVYKVEHYVERCIRSITKQTYSNLQIILVDDGSPDRAGEICDRLSVEDNRIEVIHKTNAGVSEARNTGIEKAIGKYICFVDSDDYVRENYIQELVQKMEETNAELVICGHKRSNKNANIFSFPEGMMEKTNSSFLKYLSVGLEACYPWNKMFCLDIIKKNNIRFPVGVHPGEDLIFCLTYIQYVKKVFCLKKFLYIYVDSINSVMKRSKEKSVFNNYYLQIKPVKELLDYTDNKDLKLCYKVRLYEISVSLIYDNKKYNLKKDLSKIIRIQKKYQRYFIEASFVPISVKIHYLIKGWNPILFDYCRSIYRKFHKHTML